MDDLVSREEGEEIVIASKGLHDGKDVLEVKLIVGRPRLGSMEMLVGERRVDVQDEVDTCGSEHSHTLIVVLGGVHRVDTDGVDLELLEEDDITGALLGVDERIPVVALADLCGSSRLVVETLDLGTVSTPSILRRGRRVGCSRKSPCRRR